MTPTRGARSPSTTIGKAGTLPVPASDLLALLDSHDLEGVIDASFLVVQRVVRCDFVSAFYRSSPQGLLKERDSRGRTYTRAFLQRYMELTPAIPLAMANRGVRMLTTREAIPGHELAIRASAFYREVMQPQGWRHGVALCFWSEPADVLPMFVLSAYRTEGRRDFMRPDLARLDGIHPFIACAINRLHERERARSMRDGMALTGRDGNRGLAVLDANLQLLEANAMARRLAAAWGVAPPPQPRGQAAAWLLPPELAVECQAMRREWEAILPTNPDADALRRRRIQHARVNTLSAAITMVCRNTTGLSEPSFVLEFERRAPRATVKRRLDGSLLQTLTAAERAVALIVMEGLSNQEIADRLSKSVDAVKFLLHRVYRKTGVASRAALVAALRA